MNLHDKDVERKRKNVKRLKSNKPVLNVNRCRDCGHCVALCRKLGPSVLSIAHGRISVARPMKCISDGACLLACSTKAISLSGPRRGPFGAHAA